MASQIDRVVTELRGRILAGTMRPGDRVVELKFTRELQVSRTPLRLALVELEREGLLERLPTRGFRVRRFTMDQIAEAVDVRGILEGMAARLTAERPPDPTLLAALDGCLDAGQQLIDDAMRQGIVIPALPWSDMNLRFHTLLVRGSGNAVLEAATAFVSRTPMASAGALTLQGIIPELETAYVQRAQDDHVDCVAAIREGAGARAEAIMREHAHRSGQNKRTLMARLAQTDQAHPSPLLTPRSGKRDAPGSSEAATAGPRA
jgi:GntR family transcriptional regulator of vanillate catabolism